jgi:hypothetical protein
MPLSRPASFTVWCIARPGPSETERPREVSRAYLRARRSPRFRVYATRLQLTIDTAQQRLVTLRRHPLGGPRAGGARRLRRRPDRSRCRGPLRQRVAGAGLVVAEARAGNLAAGMARTILAVPIAQERATMHLHDGRRARGDDVPERRRHPRAAENGHGDVTGRVAGLLVPLAGR